MKIILKESVKSLGVAGDLVDVKRGYMRNYLFPRGYAIPANEINLRNLEGMIEAVRVKNEAKKSAAESLASQLEGKALFFVLSASEEGRLFGSVSARSIVESCEREFHVSIPQESVSMSSKIKAVGLHSVEIVLHGEVSVNMIIGVAANPLAIEKLKKEYYGVQDIKEEIYRAESEEWNASKPQMAPYSSEYVEDESEEDDIDLSDIQEELNE